MSVADSFKVGAIVFGPERRRLQLLDRDSYELYLSELPPGLAVEVAITPDVAGPRTRQVRYWFVIVRQLAKHFGVSPREAHRDLLAMCFGFERSPVTDHWMPKRASLSWLSAEEMSQLIDWTIDMGRNVWKIAIDPPDANRRKP